MCDVSVIIPVYNAAKWINDCMEAIANQTALNKGIILEIVVYNDGSTDCTEQLLCNWNNYFKECGVSFKVTGSNICKGVGAAKNGAIRISEGEYLCFQDVDDVMKPNRILLQFTTAQKNRNAIIGSRICRVPINSTPRFVRWANNLDQEALKFQIYTSHGPTLLMPTWFCHKSVYERVGSFDESGHGTPEDLIFFYAHLDSGGDLIRVNEELVIYTYHLNATTLSIKRDKIWELQLSRIENNVLPFWNSITIWNAGKAGRKLVRKLSSESQKKLKAFCDVDKNKIGRTIELYCPKHRTNVIKLPVIHYSQAVPPLIICMKLDLTNGEFENNLSSLNLIEGKDYIIFN